MYELEVYRVYDKRKEHTFESSMINRKAKGSFKLHFDALSQAAKWIVDKRRTPLKIKSDNLTCREHKILYKKLLSMEGRYHDKI